jgi:hypothetical protein
MLLRELQTSHMYCCFADNYFKYPSKLFVSISERMYRTLTSPFRKSTIDSRNTDQGAWIKTDVTLRVRISLSVPRRNVI